eukprot:CFRG7827T1
MNNPYRKRLDMSEAEKLEKKATTLERAASHQDMKTLESDNQEEANPVFQLSPPLDDSRAGSSTKFTVPHAIEDNSTALDTFRTSEVDYGGSVFLMRWIEELKLFEWVFIVISCAVLLLTVIVTSNSSPRSRPFTANDASLWLPYEENSVSYLTVVLVGVFGGGTIVIITEYIYQRQTVRARALFAAFRMFLCYLCAAIWVFSFTETMKVMMGELRPDFVSRCTGQPSPIYNGSIEEISYSLCTRNNSNFLDEGRKGFPSGHTSSAMVFAVWISLQWLHVACTCKNRWLAQLLVCCSFIPLAIAFSVGMSRVWDNRHKVHDVVGGACLGAGLSVMVFVPIRIRLSADFESNTPTKDGTNGATGP